MTTMTEAIILISLVASMFCFIFGLLDDNKKLTTCGFYLILLSIWFEIVGIGMTIQALPEFLS